MNIEEYNTKLKEIGVEYQNKKRELAILFAKSNNPYKAGDVVTDHIGSVLVETIGVDGGFNSSRPCCTYTGLVLKKDGTPTKKGEKRTVYQSNIITH